MSNFKKDINIVGSNQYVIIPDSDDWYFSSGLFCWELDGKGLYEFINKRKNINDK